MREPGFAALAARTHSNRFNLARLGLAAEHPPPQRTAAPMFSMRMSYAVASLDYEALRAEFDAVLEERDGSISVDAGKLQEAVQQLCVQLLWADYLLQRAATPRDRLHCIGLVARQFLLFTEAIFGEGFSPSARRLLVTLQDLYCRGVAAEELRLEKSVGDAGETSYADYVRDAAVFLLGAATGRGHTVENAAKRIADIWNKNPALFSRFKSATGRRGKSFNSRTIIAWWENSDPKPRTPRANKKRPAIEKLIDDVSSAPAFDLDELIQKHADLLLANLTFVSKQARK